MIRAVGARDGGHLHRLRRSSVEQLRAFGEYEASRAMSDLGMHGCVHCLLEIAEGTQSHS